MKREKQPVACRLHGPKYPENRLKVITGVVELGPVLDAAHRYGASLTPYLCACLLQSIRETVPVRALKRPVVLAVPVDLRRHFPSASARNFFCVLPIGYDFKNNSGDFPDILLKISNDLRAALAPETLAKRIDTFSAVEHNAFARATPLFIKDIVLRSAYRKSMRGDTAGLSNIGAVAMPKELVPLIRSFDICSGTGKLQVCVCSFQDKLSVSFSSPFVSSEVARRFFRALAGLGARVEIASNPAGDGRKPA